MWITIDFDKVGIIVSSEEYFLGRFERVVGLASKKVALGG
jgi:hypothetical protein